MYSRQPLRSLCLGVISITGRFMVAKVFSIATGLQWGSKSRWQSTWHVVHWPGSSARSMQGSMFWSCWLRWSQAASVSFLSSATVALGIEVPPLNGPLLYVPRFSAPLSSRHRIAAFQQPGDGEAEDQAPERRSDPGDGNVGHRDEERDEGAQREPIAERNRERRLQHP